MEQDNKTKGKVSIILGVVMAVISVLIFCGSIVDDILPGSSWILPSLVVAIIHFIISYIRMSRRVKAQEKR